jgi:hypothetical protein
MMEDGPMSSETGTDKGQGPRDQGTTAARRDVLKAMTGATAVAAAALVGAAPEAEAQQTGKSFQRESKEERTKARYQPDAPDVQAYYRTNRY